MWCPLPWTHVGIKNNGSLRMCSHSQSAGTGNTLLYKGHKQLTINDLSADVLNCDTLKDVRKDIMAGNWPEQCTRCKIESDSKGTSRNQWESEKESIPKDDLLSRTLEDGTLLNPLITNYDLRVGNHCNLRCVMCFPGESSKWFDIYEEVNETPTFKVDGTSYKISDGVDIFNWIRTRGNIDKVVDSAPTLTKLSISGGEPMAIKHHMDVLRGLIDKGIASEIELEYSTNLTLLPDIIFPLWKKFKRVIICCSLDALGVANEAVRYPSKWDKIVSNLNAIDNTDDNIHAFTSTTLSILTLEHFADLMEWINQQNWNKINKFEGHPNLASHLVYNPKYLNIGILQKDQFERIWLSKPNPKQSYYSELYNHIKLKDEDAHDHRLNFVNKFYKFQQLQNQDWITIFPEAYKVVKEWESL